MKCHKGTANFCLSPIQPAQKGGEVSASEKERVDNFHLLSNLRPEFLLCLCSLQGMRLPQPCAAAVKSTASHHANTWDGHREMAVASSQTVVEGSVGFLQGLDTRLHSPCAVPSPKALPCAPSHFFVLKPRISLS